MSQTVVVHGTSVKQATARLRKVLAGRLHLATSEDRATLVVASEADRQLYSPVNGTPLLLSDERIEASSDKNDTELHQYTCASCNHVCIATAEIQNCVACGRKLESGSSKLNLSAVQAAAITDNLENTDMPMKKVKASRDLPLDEFEDEGTLTAGDEEETEDMGDEEIIDEETDVEAEDMGDEETEEEVLDDEEVEASDEFEDEEVDDGEDLTEEAGDEEDMGDDLDEEDMSDEEGQQVNCSDLCVTARSLETAAQRFTRRALARATRNTTVASAQIDNVRFTDVVIANCDCGHVTVASDEVDEPACASCGHVFASDELSFGNTFVAEDMEGDEDEVEVIDEEAGDDEDMEGDEDELDVEAEDMSDDLGEEDMGDEEELDVEAEDMEIEDDLGDEELAGALDTIDTEGEGDLEPGATIEAKGCKSKKKGKGKKRAMAGSGCKTKAEEGDTEDGDEFSDEIDELDLSEGETGASDKLALAFMQSPTSTEASAHRWALTVNDLPVATLSYANLKGELKTVAGDNFARRAFYDTLAATLFSDRSKTMTVAKEIGFEGIRVPVAVDRIVSARVAEAKREALASADRRFQKHVESFKRMAVVAGNGINCGFFRGVNNPVRAALASSISKLGIRGGTKVIAQAFDENGKEMVERLVTHALDLMNKTPEARKQIAQAINQMGPGVEAADEDSDAGTTEAPEDNGGSSEFTDLLDTASNRGGSSGQQSQDTIEASDNTQDAFSRSLNSLFGIR